MPVRLGIHFSHCFTVFLQFILINLLLSNMVCSDEVLWPTSDFFWRLVMNDDEVMWRSSYNTKCTIFYHSSIYLAIQNIQNVQYSTISKYTKYTKYTKYSTIVLYTLQYLHVPWFLQPYWTKSSLSALIGGVQTCTILLHCKCWEPWQAKSSLSTFQWDWKTDL